MPWQPRSAMVAGLTIPCPYPGLSSVRQPRSSVQLELWRSVCKSSSDIKPTPGGGAMQRTRLWKIGGLISGVVLILFGAGALYLGINGYRTVGDELTKEQIVGGSDMSPAEIQKAASEAGLPATIALPTCDVVDENIDTGTQARCFARYMRIHALEASGGLSYAQM